MSMIKYDPFKELRSLQDEMNRIFHSNFPTQFSHEEMATGGWMPSVDIYESEGEIVLEAELPGMKREDFDLSIENNVITLKGERHFEKNDETDNYHRVERAYGSFTRSFSLPSSVSAESTSADFKNGILRVSLPKKEETNARKIEVMLEESDLKKVTSDLGKETSNK